MPVRLGLSISLVLVGTGALLYEPPSSAVHAVPATATVIAAKNNTSFELPSIATLAETVRRPLFTAGRRPQVASTPRPTVTATVPQPKAESAPSLSGVSVSAIIITSHAVPTVLINIGSGANGTRRVVVGDDVQGWTLAAIAPEAITLTWGAERRVLSLRNFGGPSSPAPGVGPAPARSATGGPLRPKTSAVPQRSRVRGPPRPTPRTPSSVRRT
jgi:hypothetical protein